MLVYAYNPETDETALKPVVATFEKETRDLIHIRVNEEEIRATPTHPFYVPQKGWIKAVDLRAGDQLRLLNGAYAVVEEIAHELLEAPVTVYNFEVADYHTYFVSGSAVLVHNSCGSKNFEKMGSQKGNAPRNNRAQNSQFNSVAREYGLNKDQARRLHDEISGKGYGRNEIIGELISMFPDRAK